MKLLVKNETERKILKFVPLNISFSRKSNLKIYQVSIMMIYSNLTLLLYWIGVSIIKDIPSRYTDV